MAPEMIGLWLKIVGRTLILLSDTAVPSPCLSPLFGKPVLAAAVSQVSGQVPNRGG